MNDIKRICRMCGENKLIYYKNLDGIRGIAVLLVMFGHFFATIHSKYNFIENLLRKSSILGQLGVALFFVLSGFLITRILIYTKKKKNFFKNFYVRRVLRIFPLYYLFLLLYYFVFPFIFDTKVVSFSEQLYYYSYLQNFALTFGWNASGPIHFWSLAVEEHFYLFWPFLIYVVKNKKIFKVILIIIISSIILRYLFLINKTEVYYFTFTRIDALSIGAVLALLERNVLKSKISSKFYIILLFVILLPTFILWIYYGGASNNLLQILKYLLFSVGFFALIGFITKLKKQHFTNKLLTTKFLTYTGKISYGLYVYHIFSFHLIQKFFNFDSWLIQFLLCFISAYIISTASFYYFESKFLYLKKYFTFK